MDKHSCENPECEIITTNPKYCSKKCAVTVNNSKRPKRTAKVSGPCERCGEIIKYKKRSDRARGGYYRRRFCNKCLPFIRSKRTRELNLSGNGLVNDKVSNMTKQELLDYYGGDPYKFKVKITNHAKYIWKWLDRTAGCELCDFEFNNICHKVPVKDFSGSALIKEINSDENLIGLCPNHHYLLDRGLLNLKQLE